MVDTTLTSLRTSQPFSEPVTGDEPIETVATVATGSKCAIHREFAALPINPQAGASYTLVVSDQGKVIRTNTGSANTVTVPPNATQPIPIGAVIAVRQSGSGQTTIANGGGVTVNRPASLAATISEQGRQILLHKIGLDEWDTDGSYSIL